MRGALCFFDTNQLQKIVNMNTPKFSTRFLILLFLPAAILALCLKPYFVTYSVQWDVLDFGKIYRDLEKDKGTIVAYPAPWMHNDVKDIIQSQDFLRLATEKCYNCVMVDDSDFHENRELVKLVGRNGPFILIFKPDGKLPTILYQSDELKRKVVSALRP